MTISSFPASSVLAFIALIPSMSLSQTFDVLHHFGSVANKAGTGLRSPVVPGPGGRLYGTTGTGGGRMRGAVFSLRPDGQDFTLLKSFLELKEGADPRSALLVDGSTLYGTTSAGGEDGGGTVFRMGADGSGFQVLKSLPAGSYARNLTSASSIGMAAYEADPPMGGLSLDDGWLYGTTRSGGPAGLGAVFRLRPDGSAWEEIHHFAAAEGAAPTGDLTVADGIIYGTASTGGTGGHGTVFRMKVDGSGFANLKHFSKSDGSGPFAGLVLSDGVLYGTTVRGGTSFSGVGTVFRIGIDGAGFGTIKHFSPPARPSDGYGPLGRLVLSGDVLYGAAGQRLPGSGGTPTLFRLNRDGSGFATIVSGSRPGLPGVHAAAGVAVVDGVVYVATTVFAGGLTDSLLSVRTDGSERRVLRVFSNSSGDASVPGFLTLVEGRLVGISARGGDGDAGTLFAMDRDGGQYRILHHFEESTDGLGPRGTLAVVGAKVFGVAANGGPGRWGTVFEHDVALGTFRVMHAFDGVVGGNPTGLNPAGPDLVGSTEVGGDNANGGVFRITPQTSELQWLKDFTNGPGAGPVSAPVLVGDRLYGTTTYGGEHGRGNLFSISPDGSRFEVRQSFSDDDDSGAAEGWLTAVGTSLYGIMIRNVAPVTGFLYRFDPVTGAFSNVAGLGDARLGAWIHPGLTELGGFLYGVGTRAVFRIRPDGTDFAVVKELHPEDEGAGLLGPMTAVDGMLYGCASAGGRLGEGTVFRFDPRPVLEVAPVGGTIAITWPGYAAEWRLESTQDLAHGPWTGVPVPAPEANGARVHTVTPGADGRDRFYRLRR